MPKAHGNGSGSRPAASANWLALKKELPKKSGRKSGSAEDGARKRRKIEHTQSPSPEPSRFSLASRRIPAMNPILNFGEDDIKNGESLSALRNMIFGQTEYTDHQQLPGKYLALDCEMVGVGIDGAESSLARVSLVNFHGAIQLDEFVRQRERVIDYRTQYSGVRESDMVNAKSFDDIQKQVAGLLEDRILVGHAVHNDLKALLLSHPRLMTRDTQYYAGKHKVARSKKVALRNLVKQEINVTIQGGEHSSVTDARATMAVYRLHRKTWEKDHKPLAKKRKRDEAGHDLEHTEADDMGREHERSSTTQYPGGGRKGVSSGLTTVVRRGANANNDTSGGEKTKTKWWKELVASSKGSMRVISK
ncbi:RNA exonuclease 4 [Hypsizygus marmoreus]|uniref:RNA exonuclease 4 n=1 Tax=Hypsizygus marmoreus TaxID=39966 RepID=A0A369JJQ7_HYPMA|nr:RNA exonuclease 4 [Hypsizygus marmoreus]